VDEKYWVCIESESYENLVDRVSTYEETINAVRDFVVEESFLRLAKENGYTDSAGYVTDWEGLFWFFHDRISGALHYCDAMKES
jgi:hypothetical protein